jgi:serine/threonine protein kinase
MDRGAFSECRVAIKKNGSKKVVIKHIHTDYVLPNYKNQIHFEFDILSQLSHPSVLHLEEVFSCYGDYFMVTEHLGGGELFDVICDKEVYLEEDIRHIMVSVIRALKYCHSRNVIHRDIKPENLILSTKSSYNSVKIIDFGFARVIGNGKELPHDLRGTPYYLAPEVIKQVPYSKPVDIWSMGCIFHLLLVGVLPFESHDIDKLYKLIQVSNSPFKSHTNRLDMLYFESHIGIL